MHERDYSTIINGHKVSYTVRFYGGGASFFYLNWVDGKAIEETDPIQGSKEFRNELNDFLQGKSSQWKYKKGTYRVIRVVDGRYKQVWVNNLYDTTFVSVNNSK